MRRADSRVFVLTALVLATTTIAVAAEVGPSNGSLVIAGGGVSDPAIYERFVSLAGGPEAPIVISRMLPTAASHRRHRSMPRPS